MTEPSAASGTGPDTPPPLRATTAAHTPTLHADVPELPGDLAVADEVGEAAQNEVHHEGGADAEDQFP
jgi:hypothetical protein